MTSLRMYKLCKLTSFAQNMQIHLLIRSKCCLVCVKYSLQPYKTPTHSQYLNVEHITVFPVFLQICFDPHVPQGHMKLLAKLIVIPKVSPTYAKSNICS